MRSRIAATASVLCCVLSAASAAQAGSYPIDFSSLAPEAGQTLTTISLDGFTFADPSGFYVIGPGNVNYTGVIGLAPFSGGSAWTVSSSGVTGLLDSAGGSSFTVTVAAVEFGVPTYSLQLTGTLGGTQEWQQTVTRTPAHGDNLSNSPGLPAVDTISVADVTTSAPYQFTNLFLQTAGSSVPEPSTAAMGLGVLVSVLVARVWPRRRAA